MINVMKSNGTASQAYDLVSGLAKVKVGKLFVESECSY